MVMSPNVLQLSVLRPQALIAAQGKLGSKNRAGKGLVAQ
jgi:hypothetical protein